MKLDGSYYWHNELGGTVSLFDSWGSKDALLYAGNSALRPDSQGVLFQIEAALAIVAALVPVLGFVGI